MTKELAIREEQVTEFLTKMEPKLEKYSPNNSTFDVLQSALIAITETDTLKECLATAGGKASLANALKMAVSTGLSLNPISGEASLIAYKGNCSYQVQKNGLVKSAISSGEVQFITSDIVMENDKFTTSKTMSGDDFHFEPALQNRGKIIGYFAAMKMSAGQGCVKYMTVEQVEAVRDKYSMAYKFAKDKSKSAWGNSFDGMAIKTVIKALINGSHLSAGIKAVANSEDRSFEPEETKGESAYDVMVALDAKVESRDGDGKNLF